MVCNRLCKVLFYGIILFGSLLQAAPVYFVALAGGVGERLWPLSTVARPKQFLCLHGNKTLLEDTYARIVNLVQDGHFWVVTTQDYASLTRSTCPTAERILIEPMLRNTAPAICLACLQVAREHPDAVVVILPSDHFVSPVQRFRSLLTQAIEYCVRNEVLMLLGAMPTYPATGYGYIKCSRKSDASCGVMHVVSFHEKPAAEAAQTFLESGCMLWNAGIFCARVQVFLQELQMHAPQVFNGVKSYIAGSGQYADLPSISIDYAVLEKSTRLRVMPLDISWSDVGNLREFLTIHEKCTPSSDRVVKVDAPGTLVYGSAHKIIALIDVANVCVVDTPQALVIAAKDTVEKVKIACAKAARQN